MNRIARSIFVLIGLTAVSTMLSSCWLVAPKDRLYSFVCFNTSDRNGNIHLRNSNPHGHHDWQDAEFDAAQNPGSPGHDNFEVYEQPYDISITAAVDSSVLATFNVTINGRYGDAHWGDYTADAILVWGPGGGFQASLQQVDAEGNRPIAYLITGQGTTPIYPHLNRPRF